MSTPARPSREEILAYAVGKLSDADSQRVAEYVESDPECQAMLATLDGTDDTLVGQLRLPPADDPYAVESACNAALARAKGDAGGVTCSIPSLALGTLGEYQLLEKLGQGGMGTVYKALHTKLDRVVALKVIAKQRMNDPQAVARFEREMKAVGRLDHPGIVHAVDAREIDGTPVLVMEFVDGMDLGRLVRRHGPIAVSDACELIRRTAVALEYAHQHGLVHRDIKPSNLMLTRSGEVKILDLGLARLGGDGWLAAEQSEAPASGELGQRCATPQAPKEPTGLTFTGQAMGTADYMAPEQIASPQTVDIRADIYSLGCTLFKLLTGRVPFDGTDFGGTLEKLAAHTDRPAPRIAELVDVPEALAALLDRMLAKSPDDRPATPAAVAEAIAPFCKGHDLASLLRRAEEQPLSGALRLRTSAQPLPRARRWKLVAAMVGLMLLFGGIGFALGVLITVRHGDKQTALRVPDKSKVDINEDGSINVSTPTSPPKDAKQTTFPSASPGAALTPAPFTTPDLAQTPQLAPTLQLPTPNSSPGGVTSSFSSSTETSANGKTTRTTTNTQSQSSSAGLVEGMVQPPTVGPLQSPPQSQGGARRTHGEVIAGGMAPGQSQPIAAKPDEEAIQGTWAVISQSYGGASYYFISPGTLPKQTATGQKFGKPEDATGETARFIFSGDTIKVRGRGVWMQSGKYQIKPDSKERLIDMALPGSDNLLGIYKLEGDRLTICIAANKRPTEFWPEFGSDRELLVLRRIGDVESHPDEKAILGDWHVVRVNSEKLDLSIFTAIETLGGGYVAPQTAILAKWLQKLTTVNFQTDAIRFFAGADSQAAVNDPMSPRHGGLAGSYAMDATREPCVIDVSTPSLAFQRQEGSYPKAPDGCSLRGIYRLTGQQLVIRFAVCVRDISLANRPKDFDSPLAKDQFEMTLSRKPPQMAGHLDFRLAPTKEQALSSQAFDPQKRAGDGLGWFEMRAGTVELGPFGAASGGEGPSWSETPDGGVNRSLLTHPRGDKMYVLLSTKPDEVLLGGRLGPPEWKLRSVEVIKDKLGHPALALQLDEAGGKRLAKLTGEHLDRPMAILVDDRVVAAPTIKSAIQDKVEICGNLDQREIDQLADALRSGMEKTRETKAETKKPEAAEKSK